jgi:exonuclease I
MEGWMRQVGLDRTLAHSFAIRPDTWEWQSAHHGDVSFNLEFLASANGIPYESRYNTLSNV